MKDLTSLTEEAHRLINKLEGQLNDARESARFWEDVAKATEEMNTKLKKELDDLKDLIK